MIDVGWAFVVFRRLFRRPFRRQEVSVKHGKARSAVSPDLKSKSEPGPAVRPAGDNRYPPIAGYAMLSDCHSAALVSREGSVDWCCFHRFDARPVFSRILDWRRGGFFQVRPSVDYSVRRRYLDGTNVLETTFETAGGALIITDCLPVADMNQSSSADEEVHPYHQLLRRVQCVSGSVAIEVRFVPRFDYGLTIPETDLADAGLFLVYGGADAILLQSEIPMTQTGLADSTGKTELAAGEITWLSITDVLPHRLRRPAKMKPAEMQSRLDATVRYWTDWSGSSKYKGPYRTEVERSALVLKGLTNAPTGGIAAAATTSLPEQIGGVRNWDYRYCWLRDSALDLYALFALGYTAEADAFEKWITRTTAGRASDLQIVYGLGGERFLPELELWDLEGYRGSRPVRLGNAAWRQFQLDVYGELMDTAWLYCKNGGYIDQRFWDFLRRVVHVVSEKWTEPDEGIWEVRGPRRHFVFSKMMTWVAVDRGIRIAEKAGLRGELPAWRKLRDQIHAQVLAEGIDPAGGFFVQSYGSKAIDSATLLAPLVGFVPRDHPAVKATADRVAQELTVDGLVYRYLSDDGLPGDEGAFVICSFWLIDNLAVLGEVDRARGLFEQLCGYSNDVGLFAEEIDPGTKEFLGNFPQAFSHVGLIGGAINLAKAERRARRNAR